ncbi:hypothetical protein [Mucilaginibacter mallensis]|uniref:hypothetical protein n=1 Tax=Mucilaginibacter mallensis TaxID=652787 RepID=UPI0012FC4D10|nr:hypothetical protein [Mucilaginibacter mallensis]
MRHQWRPSVKGSADQRYRERYAESPTPAGGCKIDAAASRRREWAAPLVPPFEQTDNRNSDYRRTAKAASRFWLGSTKVLPKQPLYIWR